MEDFGPLLWILLAGAAMAYSAASNAKKQAKKGKKAPHQEAWPTQRPRKAVLRQTDGTDAMRPTPVGPSQPDIFGTEPWSFDREYEEENVSEIQSLEAPTSASVAPAASMAAGSRSSFGSNMISERFVAQNQPAWSSVQTPQSVGYTTDCDEEDPLEIAEEFELRKAVIYSEILKPKFEE